ncbi:hypothetical protein CsSME_00002521 [Camellia sinensis var. sinensis]
MIKSHKFQEYRIFCYALVSQSIAGTCSAAPILTTSRD